MPEVQNFWFIFRPQFFQLHALVVGYYDIFFFARQTLVKEAHDILWMYGSETIRQPS